MDDRRAGVLTHRDSGYEFVYDDGYQGPPVSLTMPVTEDSFQFNDFPPFFDGLLPEGALLEALLRQAKLDRRDFFGQLVTVGQDLVGNVTVFPVEGFGGLTSRQIEDR